MGDPIKAPNLSVVTHVVMRPIGIHDSLGTSGPIHEKLEFLAEEAGLGPTLGNDVVDTVFPVEGPTLGSKVPDGYLRVRGIRHVHEIGPRPGASRIDILQVGPPEVIRPDDPDD